MIFSQALWGAWAISTDMNVRAFSSAHFLTRPTLPVLIYLNSAPT
jgi:hypothetical protein